jgi:hypothetical protein
VLEELARSQILTPRSLDCGTTGYLANDIFELLVFTERSLASARWDTRPSRRRKFGE